MPILRRLGEASVGLALGAAAALLSARRGRLRASREPQRDHSPRRPPADDEPMREHATTWSTTRCTPRSTPGSTPCTATAPSRGATPRAPPVRELWLHLYLNAFKNERTAFSCARPSARAAARHRVADWGYIDVRKLVARELDGVDLWPGADKTTPGDPEDETDIRVPLPARRSRRARRSPSTSHGTRSSRASSSAPATAGDFHMVAQWFPKIARLEPNGAVASLSVLPPDRVLRRLRHATTSPSTCPRDGRRRDRARRSDRARRGATSLRYQQSDVHDFAWTAWDRFARRRAEAEGVDIRVPVSARLRRVADREIATASFALEYFGERYGRYPYPVLTIVHPPAGRRRSRRHGVPDAHHDGRRLVLAVVRARRRSGHDPRARPPVLLRARGDRRADVAVARRRHELLRRSRRHGRHVRPGSALDSRACR